MILKKLKPMPKDFLWGASTSAYQVEGANLTHGKGPSVQDIKKVPEGTSELDVCADFYHHYKEDIALMAEMGFKTFRSSGRNRCGQSGRYRFLQQCHRRMSEIQH